MNKKSRKKININDRKINFSNKKTLIKIGLPILILIIVIAVILKGCSHEVIPKEEIEKAQKAESGLKVMLENMTLEEKIGQMIMPSMRYGDEASLTSLKEPQKNAIAKYGFGGIILFAENEKGAAQVVNLTNSLQNAAVDGGKLPLLIASDQEGGSVFRMATGTPGVGNMAVAATGKTKDAYYTGKIIGDELRAAGMNVDFGPVVDVNSNPQNPIIGIRSFSDDPDTAAAYGSKYIKGLRDSGTAAALKHFPGHGNTEVDSHTGLPSINSSLDELMECDLVPFNRGIGAGAQMIMTAHIQYPAVEGETAISTSTGKEIYLPATLSKKILTDLLRDRMGFTGVIVTDSMQMGAISSNFEETDAAVRAINAGVDILLMPMDIASDSGIAKADKYIANISAKVKEGAVSEERIDESALRILKLKYNLGLIQLDSEKSNSDADGITKDTGLKFAVKGNVKDKIDNAEAVIGSEKNRNYEWKIACDAVTAVKNEGVLPYKLSSGSRILFLTPSMSDATWYGYAMIKLKEDGVIPGDVTYSTYAYGNGQSAEMKKKMSEADAIIAITKMDGISGIKSSSAVNVIAAAHEQKKKITFISTGLPYDVAALVNADAVLLTFGHRDMANIPSGYGGEVKAYGVNVSAAAYDVLGGHNITGKLPVDIFKLDGNGEMSGEILYERGTGIKIEAEK